MLSRILPVATLASLVIGVGATAASGAALAPAPPRAGSIALTDDAAVVDLFEQPDGNVRVLTTEGDGTSEFSYQGSSSDAKLRMRTLGDAGEIGGPVDLQQQKAGSAGFLPDGTTLRLTEVSGKRNRRLGAVVGDATSDGSVTRSVTVSGKAPQSWSTGWQAGPTGAVLLWLVERTATREYRSVAYRPAGAAAFGTPVRLGGFSRKRQYDPMLDPDGDGQDHDYQVAFAPDGGAAILSLPDSADASPTWLRWISPAGQFGTKVFLGLHSEGEVRGQAVIGPDGRLTIVVASLSDKAAAPAYERGETFAASLPAGSLTAPNWQRLSKSNYWAVERSLITLAVSPAGHVAALVSADANHLRLFEGDGAQLRLTTKLGSVFPENAYVLADSDGRISAAWQEEALDDGDFHFDDEGVFVTSRAPGAAAFSVPRRITPKLDPDHQFFPALEMARPLSGGRLAIVYREYHGNNGPAYATIVRP